MKVRVAWVLCMCVGARVYVRVGCMYISVDVCMSEL